MVDTPAPPRSVRELLGPGGLRLEITGRRADVVLATPERRNAQTPATWRALAAAGAWACSVADVVVLRAEGASFSAGLDRRAFTPEGLGAEPGLHQLASLPDGDLDATVARFQEAFTCWGRGDAVSVAAVQGHAVGAGFQLALACDLRVLADDARLAMRETSLGLVPDLGGTRPLVRAVGYARALEICATGRWVDAAQALDWGLANAVAPVEALAGAVDTLVADVLQAPPGAVRETKRLLATAMDASGEEQLAAERAAQARRLRELAGR
jgi:enoyl-CoA hydratase/carnithine racemase